MSKRDTRQEILETAASLFFLDGYHVGVDRIISESRVAKMTFYKHFPSKDKLICRVLTIAYGSVDRRMREIAADSKQTPLDRAHSALDFLCESMNDPTIRGGLICRGVVELDEETEMSRKLACFCLWQIFCAVRRACLKAGTKGPDVGRQILMVVTGGYISTPIFDQEPRLAAAKAAARDILNRALTNA